MKGLSDNKHPRNQKSTAHERCGAEYRSPTGIALVCSRDPEHPDDHFDELHGWGWPNESVAEPALAADEAYAELLNEVLEEARSELHGHGNGLEVARAALTAYIDALRRDVARQHALLDRLRVPQGRDDRAFTLAQRANLLVDRQSRGMLDQAIQSVEAYNAIRDALTLLESTRTPSRYQINAAVERLRGVMPDRAAAAGLRLE